MKKILVTGGAGFIGSHLVNKLTSLNYEVTILDNLERGDLKSILQNKLVNIKICDLTDFSKIHKYFKNQDIVIHLASKVGGIGVYVNKPYEIMSTNMQIDINIVKAVMKYKIKKLFYASSAHIYPKNLQLTSDSPAIFESDGYPANPELSYGWAKLIGEKLIESVCTQNEWLKVAIARFIGIYGPNQDYNLDTGSVIPVFSHRAIKYPEIPFKILGNGDETRSYCYIDDAIECILKMIENMNTAKLLGPYNVGKNERISINDIAKIIIEISNKKINIEYDLNQKTIIKGQFCDVSKIQNEIGWKAKTDIKDGISKVFQDIKQKLQHE